MRLFVHTVFVVFFFVLAGCGNSEPPQTKVPEDKVKDIMTKAKEQASREGGSRRMRK